MAHRPRDLQPSVELSRCADASIYDWVRKGPRTIKRIKRTLNPLPVFALHSIMALPQSAAPALSAIDSTALTPEARELTSSVPQSPDAKPERPSVRACASERPRRPHNTWGGGKPTLASTGPANAAALVTQMAMRFTQGSGATASSGASGASGAQGALESEPAESPRRNADDFVLCVFVIAAVAGASAHVCFQPAWVGTSVAVGWAMWGTTLTLTTLTLVATTLATVALATSLAFAALASDPRRRRPPVGKGAPFPKPSPPPSSHPGSRRAPSSDAALADKSSHTNV